MSSMMAMAEVMKLDIHASDQDVLTGTLARLQEQEAVTAVEKVSRVLQQYRARRLAVVGPQETLDAMINGQVEELLISGGMEESQPRAEEMPEAEAERKMEPQHAPMADLL